MNSYNTSHNTPCTHWQLLGELELPVELSADEAIQAWLSEILDPLDLQAHLLDQVLESAQNAAGRAMRSDRAAECGHLHFLVYAPKQPALNGQTWGFFQIEKMGDYAEEGQPGDHTIEFYLYLEG